MARVFDSLDPHAQSRQRRFEIMTDRAQHEILFIEHGGDARFHAVMRIGEVCYIARSLDRKRLARRTCSREALRTLAKHCKGPRNPAQGPEKHAHQDGK